MMTDNSINALFHRFARRRLLPLVCGGMLLAGVTPLAPTATVSAQTRTTTPDAVTLALAFHSFNLMITDARGQSIQGRLNIGNFATERARGSVKLSASFTGPAEQFRTFFNYSDAIYQYLFTRYAVNGVFTAPVFVYTGASTVGKRPTSVALSIGSPIPGSLSQGGGSAFEGVLRSDGWIVGTPGQPDSSYTDSFVATPVLDVTPATGQ